MLLARLQGSHKTNLMNAPLKLGQSILRREDRRFLTGRGRYTDDTAPSDALAASGQRPADTAFRRCG